MSDPVSTEIAALVGYPTLAIHTDLNTCIEQNFREICRSKLVALVSIKYLRLVRIQSLFQC